MTLAALGLGALVTLPLALASLARPRLRWAVLGLASVVQTVPSLALLALMVPALVALGGALERAGLPRPSAIGLAPSLVALTLYGLLPMLRGAVLGLAGVDAAVLEAARGVGMTPRQVLLRVRLPLALPVLLGGLRTAAVWVTGIATLTSAVGQTSLGTPIFGGLQTRNWTAVLVGCAAAALLALALDQLVALGESAALRRSARRALFAAVGWLALVGLGLAPLARAWLAAPRGAERPLVIGAKTFNEQFVLAALLERRLAAAGLPARRLESLGSTVAFDALQAGEVDLYVDYSGTLWRTLLRRTDTPGPDEVLAGVRDWLDAQGPSLSLGALGFENAYALAVRRATAEELGLRTIGDLAAHAGALRLASDVEFFARPEWRTLRETYGLRFAATTSMQPTLMYRAVAAGEVDVVTAFTSDGRVAAYDLVTLADDRRAFPPYDAILLVRREAAARPALRAALEPLLGAIDVATMRRANELVDVRGETVEAAASWLDETLRALGDRGPPPGPRPPGR